MQLKRKIRLVLAAVEEKKAEETVALDLKSIAAFTDSFVICSGNQRRQTQAICDAVLESLAGAGVRPGHVEGYDRGDWILIDFSDLVVHIFTREKRDFYNLERLWGDAPRFNVDGAVIRKKRKRTAGRQG